MSRYSVQSDQAVRKVIFSAHFRLCLSAQEVLPSWDRQVQNLCFQVNNVIEKINSYAPEWAAKYTESQMTS